MNSLKNIKMTAFAVALATLAGCATVPKPIDVAENTRLVSFEDVSNRITNVGPSTQMTSPDIGEKARWGGKIVSVENRKDVSEIEIVFFPEDRLGKPKTGQPSAGRFKAVVKGFVDPLVFEQGRLITVVGDVSESLEGIIGEQSYMYPTLNAKGYYMWKETTDVRVEMDSFAFSPFAFRAGYHNAYFNPWYDPWMLNRQTGRIRIDRYNGHSQGGTVKRNKASVSGMSKSTPSSTPNRGRKVESSSNAKSIRQR